jgi:glycosyltransferase involved in cell wall biosynthesis
MSVRFSVLLPVHNRENYVRQAVDSVLNQTFRDFELLVIDDGSTDRTPEILKSYGSKLKLIQQRNRGPEIARNTAAALAQGEYLVYLDSDDLFLPFALETFDKVIRATDSPPLLLGSILFFQDGEPPPQLPPPDTIEIFKFRNYASKTMSLSSNSNIVRKSVFDAVGGGRRVVRRRHFTPMTPISSFESENTVHLWSSKNLTPRPIGSTEKIPAKILTRQLMPYLDSFV